MRIIGQTSIMGDCHGDFRRIYLWLEMSRDNNLIHVGDFGAHARNLTRIAELGNACNKAGKRLYAIRGNHEDPSLFDNRIYGGEWGGVQLIKDGIIAEHNGENILFIGGGISLDRSFRQSGLDYWPNEGMVIPQTIMEKPTKVDHLITHVSISEVSGKFITDPFVLTFCANDSDLMTDLTHEQHNMKTLIDYLIDDCGNSIKSWHYGHYHQSIHSQYRGVECRGLAIDEIRPFNRK